MTSGHLVKPLITSQRYRTLSRIKKEISAALKLGDVDLPTIYFPRLVQVVNFGKSGNELSRADVSWNLMADAAIYGASGYRGAAISGPPELIVFLDRKKTPEHEIALQELKRKGIGVLFESEQKVIAQQHAPIRPTSTLLNYDGLTKAPYRYFESLVLTALLNTNSRLNPELSARIVITGQTALSSISNFTGFVRTDGRRDLTDVDILISSAPPVSFPLLAIEIDGPSHYSLAFYQEELGCESKAARRLDRERKKQASKDEACKRAEIPVLHIRVNTKAKNNFVSHLAAFSTAIIEVAHHAYEVLNKGKKYQYVNSVAQEFDKSIGDFFSTHSELEDVAQLAPDLLRYLLGELIACQEEKDHLNDLYSSLLESEIPNPLHENASFNQSCDQEVEKISNAPAEDLQKFLTFGLVIDDEQVDWAHSFKLHAAYEYPPGETRILKQGGKNGKGNIPWFEMEGFLDKELNNTFLHSLAKQLGNSMFNSLGADGQEEWKRKVLEHIEWQKAKANLEFTVQEVKSCVKTGGQKALIAKVDYWLGFIVREMLVKRQYIKRKRRRLMEPTAYEWIHCEVPEPTDWPELSHGSTSFSKWLPALGPVDELTRREIVKKVDEQMEKKSKVFELGEVPTEYIENLKQLVNSWKDQIRF